MKDRTFPRTVCCIYSTQLHFFDRREPGKKYRCSLKRGKAHGHLPRAIVLDLIAEGKAEWAGSGQHLAVTKERHPAQWFKVAGIAGIGNARVAAMQMRGGGEKRFPRMVRGGLVSPR